MTAADEVDRPADHSTRGRWRERVVAWSPPVRDRGFWITQLLVVIIAGGHALVEATGLINLGHATFIPVSLFLLPVVYAGIVYGLRGALPTALWCAALSLPNAIVWHDGVEILGEVWQATVVVAVALFVGQQIDRRRRAQAEADRRQNEKRASETKYRVVFESAGDAILLVNASSVIQDANAAAGDLIGESPDALRGQPLSSVASGALLKAIEDRSPPPMVGPFVSRDRRPRWVVPVATAIPDAHGELLTLILLRDVSSQVERQRSLEQFAGQTLAAREEERRRVARELHDGPLQSLVLLWRSLDQLDVGDPVAREAIAAARDTAEQVSADLRRFSRDLRPSVLDDLGLNAALRSEAAAFERRTGITTQFLQSGDPGDLPEPLPLTILRVCQEALHNVERHARASRVDVRLTVASSRVDLSVADNGEGVGQLPDAPDLVAAGKLGIVGMQERARLVGGRCDVTTAPAGTTVRFSAPLDGGRHPLSGP